MSLFNKMYLISPQRLEALGALDMGKSEKPRPKNIYESFVQDLEGKMEHLLKKDTTPAYTKSLQFNAILEKYLNALKKEQDQTREILLKVVPSEKTEDSIGDNPSGEDARGSEMIQTVVDHVGKNYQKNASFILNKLYHSDLLSWNTAGEVTINGELIKGSHILDLMKTLSNRRFHTKNAPTGWSEFLETISNLNIPLTTIANTHARQQLQHRFSKVNESPLPDLSDHSRKRRRRRRSEIFESPISSPPSSWLTFNT